MGSIVFALFNALFFLTDMKNGTLFSTWSTYVFIVISFAVFVATPFLSERYNIKHKIFGLVPIEFGAIYFAVQLVLGIIYILSEIEKYTPAFLVQVFLLAVYAIVLVANLIISEKTNHQPETDVIDEYEEQKDE